MDYQIYESVKAEFTYKALMLKHTLIRSVEPLETEVPFNEFFPKLITEIRTEGTKPYHQEHSKYKLHRFKLVSVKSGTKAEVLRDFIWPLYNEGIQRIFFNEDYSMMFEALENSRVFLHQWVQNPNSDDPSKGKF